MWRRPGRLRTATWKLIGEAASTCRIMAVKNCGAANVGGDLVLSKLEREVDRPQEAGRLITMQMQASSQSAGSIDLPASEIAESSARMAVRLARRCSISRRR